MSFRKLTEDEMTIMKDGRCPMCGSREGVIEGPSGSASQNIICGNEQCEAYFNVLGFGAMGVELVDAGHWRGDRPEVPVTQKLLSWWRRIGLSR